MTKVKAWCVKDIDGDLILWSASINYSTSTMVFVKNTAFDDWLEAENFGCNCVKVEIKEVSDD